METIHDRKRMERYMKELKISEHFGENPPQFLLLHYSPGDLLTSPFSPCHYIQFIAEGRLLLYDMPDDSQTVILQTNNEVGLLGEVELLDTRFDPFFVEAASDVYTLAVHLDRHREKLLNDPVFLRYVCVTLSDKLSAAVRATLRLSLKERVLRSLRHSEPGQQLREIAETAHRLGVSNRQFLRVLKSLCEEEVLVRRQKGVYEILRVPGDDGLSPGGRTH